MDSRQIIMNYTVPPSVDDLSVLAADAMEVVPEEIVGYCDSISVVVEDFPEDSIQQELDIDDPYELIALFRNGKEISPGIERKVANDDDMLILYRRPLLDLWCETQDDLGGLVRQVIIEELGRNFDFSDDEIDEMVRRHHPGLL